MSEEYKRKLEARDQEERAQYQASLRAMHERAMTEGHGIFKGLHNMIGPLSEDVRHQILKFLNQPSKANWDAVAHYLVTHNTTLWQLWVSYDPEAPRGLEHPEDPQSWPSVPDPERFREALIELGQADPVATTP